MRGQKRLAGKARAARPKEKRKQARLVRPEGHKLRTLRDVTTPDNYTNSKPHSCSAATLLKQKHAAARPLSLCTDLFFHFIALSALIRQYYS